MAAFPEIRSVESHTRATVDSGSPGRAAVLARNRTGAAGCYRAARTQGGAAVRLGPAAARVAATAGMPVEVPKAGDCGHLSRLCASSSRKPPRLSPRRPGIAGLRGGGLLGDFVGTLSEGILGGLNRQPGLAAQETDEAAHGVLLPVGRFHGVDKQMHSGRRVSR